MKRIASNAIHGVIVTTPAQFQHAVAVRSIVYMEGNGMPFDAVFDANDFVSTHLVFYEGKEPIGGSRLRWFAEFAKVERTCLRKDWQNIRNLRLAVDFILTHVARKGYSKLITHADEEYSRLWIKLFGFERVADRPVIEAPGFNPHFELVKHLAPPADAIGSDSSPSTLFRTEGAWDAPSTLG